jgi:hypothetical protein
MLLVALGTNASLVPRQRKQQLHLAAETYALTATVALLLPLPNTQTLEGIEPGVQMPPTVVCLSLLMPTCPSLAWQTTV